MDREQLNQDDLFDIKVNTSGKLYLRKFAALARIIILISILISLLNITSTIFRHISLRGYDLSNYPTARLEYKFLPYYAALYCILFFPQMYFYWQATKYFRKGMEIKDEATFNKAFRSLFLYSLFGVATILLSALSYSFELYSFITDYMK
jgi:hypothetical protein